MLFALLGALLLKRADARHDGDDDDDTAYDQLPLIDEAEVCYRADLGLLGEGGATLPHPHNIWSVTGLLQW